MKKIALVIISIMLLSGLAYSQETSKDGTNKEYYKSGKLKYEFIPNGETGGGVTKGYYESGQLEYEVIFKDKINGIYKEYYENGKQKSEGDFKFEGEQLKGGLYFKDGKLFNEEGNLVSS